MSSGESAALRDRLIADLDRLATADQAADWVHVNLPAKNRLTTDDAKLVEGCFHTKLVAIEAGQLDREASSIEQRGPDGALRTTNQGQDDGADDRPAIVDPRQPDATLNSDARDRRDTLSAESRAEPPHSSSIALAENFSVRRKRISAKTIRLRDKEHCKFVATQPCVICGRSPSEAHHLRFAQPRALGRKVSDEFTVPVCRLHHRELHAYGDEASWWAGVHLDPVPIALELWGRTRPTEAAVGVEPSTREENNSGEHSSSLTDEGPSVTPT